MERISGFAALLAALALVCVSTGCSDSEECSEKQKGTDTAVSTAAEEIATAAETTVPKPERILVDMPFDNISDADMLMTNGDFYPQFF